MKAEIRKGGLFKPVFLGTVCSRLRCRWNCSCLYCFSSTGK